MFACKGLRSRLQVVGRNWSHCFRRAHPGRKMSYSGPLCPSLLLSDYLGSNLQGPGISSGDSCEKEKPEAWCQGGVRVFQGKSSLSSDLPDHLAGESGAKTRDKQDDQSPQ